MKTILVDAINGLILRDSASIDPILHKLLEEYDTKKIIVTNANKQEQKKFNLVSLPYELFTLEHNPEKTDSSYYEKLLQEKGFQKNEVVYFEHNIEAVKSAQSVGIVTYHFDHEKRDMDALKEFLDTSL